MRLKRIIAVLATLMMSTVFMQSASAERIKFSAPEILSENGTTTVTYSLTETPAEEGATLIAAYIDPESRTILSIGTQRCDDVLLLENGKISLTIPDKSTEGGVLKHYLLKDLNKIVSLKDMAPAKVSDVSATTDSAKPYSKINLLWGAPVDDWDAAENISYNIYDMGQLVASDIRATEFGAENLKWGSRHIFEIGAVDAEGNTAKKSPAVNAETIIPYSIITTDEIYSTDGNLTFTSLPYEPGGEGEGASKYFMYTNEVMDNIPCIGTSERKGQGTYHSVQFGEQLLNDLKGDGEYIFEIEYLSVGNTYMTLELYQMENGVEAQETKRLSIINDSKWHTLTEKVIVTRDFQPEGRKNHNYSHLRFIGGNNTATGLEPFYIRRITIMPVDEYNALNPERDAYLDVQAGMISNYLELDSNPTPQKIGDYYGIVADNLTVNTESGVTASGARGIEVIYYAPEGTDEFTINGDTITVTENGSWQKAMLELENGLDSNSIVINGDVYINHIRLLNGLPAIS